MADFGTVLNKLWPNGDQKIPGLRFGIISSAQEVFSRYNITSPLVIAHIMAQISHECGAGRDVVENLNYTAKRMTQVWPKRFPTISSAEPYANNPQKLANKVYNGRMGNVVGTDDGWKYRGRGASQTTGKEGYQRVAKNTGLDVVNNPDLILDPKYFLLCGVSDFINCGCLPYAKADDVENVTKKLNGGYIGLAERKEWLSRWKRELGSAPVTFSTPVNQPIIKQIVEAPKPAPVEVKAPVVEYANKIDVPVVSPEPPKVVEQPKKTFWQKLLGK